MPMFVHLQARGCNIQFNPISDELFLNTATQDWWTKERDFVKQMENGASRDARPHLHAHLADVVRFVVIWKHGGVYLDSDILVLKPLDALFNFTGGCCSR